MPAPLAKEQAMCKTNQKPDDDESGVNEATQNNPIQSPESQLGVAGVALSFSGYNTGGVVTDKHLAVDLPTLRRRCGIEASK